MIHYRLFGSEQLDAVTDIYQANDWQSYLGDKVKLKKALNSSLYMIGAFDGDNLVGFARCIGDGEYIVYVQDLIVKPQYHRQGIGRELMTKVFAKYKNVRQLLLITDSCDDVANAFYQAIGMVSECNGYPINQYFRK